MTEQPLPKFPATPEEIKAASEKAMNFWVGALSPMWVPFWAASSFGLGAWAMSQNVTKKMGEGFVTPDALLKDMPTFGAMAAKWPGFTGIWGTYGTAAEPAPMVEPAHSPVPVPEMFTGVRAAMAAVMTQPEPEPEPVAAAETAPEPVAGPVTETAVEAVVAPEAVPAAPKVAKPKAAKAPAPKTVPLTVTPKPIAQSVSAVKSVSAAKTPKPKA